MAITLPTPLGGALFPAGPPGTTGSTGPQGAQGATGPQGAAGAAGATGPAPWSTPTPWTAGLICVASAPATAVVYSGSTYVCTVSHIAGDTFDASKFQLLIDPGGSIAFMEALTVTATDTLSALTYAYTGGFAMLATSQGALMPVGSPPPFSISGMTVTWDPSAAGFSLSVGDPVAIAYSR